MEILIATLVVGIIGLLIGIALVAAGAIFHVEVDERVAAVRLELPGNNCGACGYAGCDALAAAIAAGDAPANACPVCSASATEAIGAIMGVSVTAGKRRVAHVHCSGDCVKSPAKVDYVGIKDCRAAALAGLSPSACAYGCLGFGSCVKVCPQDAISMVDGLARVSPAACVGCGLCVETCPQGLISLVPAGVLSVGCSSHDKGPAVKKVCAAGCIGCGLCVKQCEYGAVTLENNLARIDPDKCTGCGKCAEKCPVKVITSVLPAAVSAQ